MAAGVLLAGLSAPVAPLHAQTAPANAGAGVAPVPPTRLGAPQSVTAASGLAGQTVEDVRIVGNRQVSAAVIRNVIRTRPGEPFDPQTVVEDYQRIFGLRKFANVQASVEATEGGGVIVTFDVDEQEQITGITFRGADNVDAGSLRALVDLSVGQAIDAFRVALARQAIEEYYRERNFPYAQVTVDQDQLAETGELAFDIVEGPNVRIRKVNFIGNESFTDDRLKDVVSTKSWFPIFRPGTFDLDQLEDDIALLRKYYEDRGFFDVRVGRRVVVSPDTREMQIDFVIEEGPRYRVGEVRFQGNAALPDAQLREELRLRAGDPFRRDVLDRDLRQIVREYSPLGFIYQPGAADPAYLTVAPRTVFSREPGVVDVAYEIREGRPFRLGRILVTGNTRTQDKVVLRELRVAPGQLYDAAEIADAIDRLRATPYFMNASATPIGSDPEVRDLLIEVQEARTASVTLGAGVNSNGGVGASLVYQQRNFDITDPPESIGEVFSDRALVGAGQDLRIALEPGTRQTNASIRFTEPWIFDQPYSFTGEAYYRSRDRRKYDDTRGGGRITFGKRFNYVWSAAITLRGEDVEISDVEDEDLVINGETWRAPEILDLRGHNTLTSAGLTVRRNTTSGGLMPYRGTVTTVGWDSFGALGGDFDFQQFTASFDSYHLLAEDLLERRTILNLHLDAGYIDGDAPFFERFYAGGIGSVRGFAFRGISPRSGLSEDPVGGDFSMTGSAEVSFPLAGDNFRGVVFIDAGTVEEDFEFGTIRTAAGAGIRLALPVLGQAPLAIDFAFPINEDDEDDTQIISFSFGLLP